MLDPNYILRMSEGAEEIAGDLRAEILKALVKRVTYRLNHGKDYTLTATDMWAINTLQEVGMLLDDVEKAIVKYTGLQAVEVKNAFIDAGVKSVAYDDKVYKQVGIAVKAWNADPYIMRLMQRNYERTMGLWSNYTRTTADATQRLFKKVCDDAYFAVASGATSYTDAYVKAIRTLLKGNIDTVTYPSGHKDTIETATLRAVRTGINQTCADITDYRMDEYDWDIILVSSHLGARYGDGGENYTNHQWWQGKFYSKSGRDQRFPPFSVCGMGNVQGIHGANCRHSHGVGDGVHNPFEHFDDKENKKLYDLTQKQRSMERAIRKTKHECVGLTEAITNTQNAAAKATLEQQYTKECLRLEKQNLAYNAFCEKNGLKRLPERLAIAEWDRAQARASLAAVKEAKKQGTG